MARPTKAELLAELDGLRHRCGQIEASTRIAHRDLAGAQLQVETLSGQLAAESARASKVQVELDELYGLLWASLEILGENPEGRRRRSR